MRVVVYIMIVISLFSAGAPRANAGSFCDLQEGDMLAALDGKWRVNHSSGASYVPQIGVTPFPAPKSSSIKFEYMGDLGLIFAEGMNSPETMVIIPPYDKTETELTELLGKKPRKAGDCGWGGSPVLVGTTSYPNIKSPKVVTSKCTREWAIFVAREALILLATGKQRIQDGKPVEYDSKTNACESTAIQPKDGAMQMTMVVRFTGPDFGSGRLLFQGKIGGSSFMAQTPITLSR
jgi:hypothetical protein